MGVPFAFGTTFFGGGLTYRFQIFTSDMEEMMQNEEYLFPVCGQKIRTRTHSLFFVSPLSGDAIVFSLWISERKQQRHAKTTTLSKLPLNYIPRESKDQTLPIGW